MKDTIKRPGKLPGPQRRHALRELLLHADQPLSGSALAKQFHVSRQVIVQDIALLRTADCHIIATNQGYVIWRENTPCARRFKVKHAAQQIAPELNLIVDLGGRVKNVSIHHRVYGFLTAEMSVSSRADVAEFVEAIHSGKSQPLSNATSGYHYHLVEADSEERLDKIQQALEQAGFLVPAQT